MILRSSKILIELLDILALLALYFTEEVFSKTWVIVLVIYLLRWISKIRVSGFWLIISLIGLTFSSYWLFTSFELPPILTVAQTTPVFFVLLALLKDPQASRDWRLGMGLILLILASSISPDFIISIVIFGFVILSSVYLSCRFLQTQLTHYKLDHMPLPKHFIRRSIFQTVILLISAAIIFPILPRTKNQGGHTSQTGYTEEVNVSNWSRFTEGSSSQVALRIYSDGLVNISANIPKSLLRTRALGLFDGKTWEPLPRKKSIDRLLTVQEARIPTESLQIVRETLGSPAIPVPYGVKRVDVSVGSEQWPAEWTEASEWMEYRLRNRRLQYEVEVFHAPLIEVGYPKDQPSGIYLQVPKRFKNSKIEELSKTLLTGKNNPTSKARAIQNYFIEQDFKPYLGEDRSEENSQIFSETPFGKSTLEYFLFEMKKGHCELFASSMALMLRMGGVPTRLVSGFRIGRWPVSDVLTVRMSDAHAWVEYYRKDAGWIPVDPTPKILRDPSYQDWFRDNYDWMSAKWYHYVMTFGESESFLGNRMKDIKSTWEQIKRGPENWHGDDIQDLAIFTGVFSLIAVFLSYIALRFVRIKWGTKQKYSPISARITQERIRFEKLIAKHPNILTNSQVLAHIKSWKSGYLKIRFDRPHAEQEIELKKISQIRKELRRILNGD